MSDQLKPGPWLKIHDRPLGTFVEEYAESIADNSAVRFYERDICYRELNELSNRPAHALAGLGVGWVDVVGLHLPNLPQ